MKIIKLILILRYMSYNFNTFMFLWPEKVENVFYFADKKMLELTI